MLKMLINHCRTSMLKMASKKYCHLRAQQTNPFGLTGRSHSTKAGAVQR